ncbi:CHC2 zinc finger domain-containing protein [Coprococcus comes]|nr:CHC2 zinc finger domain-containing protein [Coprococcus comes]MDC0787359.1 CHC2 zinc finger domain-containing protein [Coprococcus comes]MDC0790484.1 CHC2 zinc finger domain-containing protein [Coprococcus comes]MDC0793946.1 CHC2 zinc finger domain-containing protein [Coprococcus comes]MDC0797192.1 CHC2 zinc finger domain-containing protein [Coprococcus comes]
MSGFSYDITDVVHLLQLRVRHKNSSSMDVNCPFCGETKGKMNVNLQKNVFRCNRCDASGGMLELYGRLHGVSSAEANRQIREALGKGEYWTDYQVVHKEEPVEIFNAELADADVIDRTYQEMLSLLTLNDKHQEDLKKRGLTKEQIEIQRYRSVR